MSAPLNLARRPVRNERGPTLLLGLACVVLAAATVRHAVFANELRRGGARDAEGEVLALDREIEHLRGEAAELQRTPPPRGRLDEWKTLERLVDRRVFSWTGLFAALEAAMPPTVRLASVAPVAEHGATVLSLAAVGRSAEDAIALLKSLQASPGFQDAFLEGVDDSPDGVQITCTVRYLGADPRGPRSVPSAAAAAGGGAP